MKNKQISQMNKAKKKKEVIHRYKHASNVMQFHISPASRFPAATLWNTRAACERGYLVTWSGLSFP